jgi:hypothetical protein
MIDDMLIGPGILDDSTTGHNYLEFLQNVLPEKLYNTPFVTRNATHFKHDGASSHCTPICDAESQ